MFSKGPTCALGQKRPVILLAFYKKHRSGPWELLGACAPHPGPSEAKEVGKAAAACPTAHTWGHSWPQLLRHCADAVLTCSGPLGQDLVLSLNLSSPRSQLISIAAGWAIVILGVPHQETGFAPGNKYPLIVAQTWCLADL